MEKNQKKEYVKKLNKKFEDSDAIKIIEWAFNKYKSDLVIATAFGPAGLVNIDLASKVDIPATIISVDTGRLPEETYQLVEDVKNLYEAKFEIYFPDYKELEGLYEKKGTYSFKNSIQDRKECCRVRKVLPFYRALKGYKAWISGLRKGQSITRSEIDKFEIDRKHRNILKINPLADWSEKDVWDYIKENDVPYNELHDENYPSIGCEPCTRPVESGEGIRAGRWWWEPEENKECGLHVFGPSPVITIYLDIDGTILDTQDRHYEVYKDIMKNSPQSILSPEAYWSLKRAGFSVFEILEQTGNEEHTEEFVEEWMKRIETDEYLEHDIPFPKIYKIMDILAQEYRIVGVSGRKNRKSLIQQLNELDLDRYFDKVLSAPSGEEPSRVKAELIRKDESFDDENSWIVGDTEADIEAGKILDINTIGVLSGIRNKRKMKELGPDHMIEDITELPELLFFENQ